MSKISASRIEIELDKRCCRVIYVKYSQANSLKNGRFLVSQDAIASNLTGHDLHNLGPMSEFLVKPLDEVGRSQGDPFLRGEIGKVRQASRFRSTAEAMAFCHFRRKALKRPAPSTKR